MGDMKSQVTVRWCPLQMADDLWQCLGKLKCIGGQLKAQGCEAMGLVGTHEAGLVGFENDEQLEGTEEVDDPEGDAGNSGDPNGAGIKSVKKKLTPLRKLVPKRIRGTAGSGLITQKAKGAASCRPSKNPKEITDITQKTKGVVSISPDNNAKDENVVGTPATTANDETLTSD